MMKRKFRVQGILCVMSMIVFLLPQSSFASIGKLFGGIIMTAAGTYLAVDGFEKVKQRESAHVEGKTYYVAENKWYVSGNVINEGDCDILWARVRVHYYFPEVHNQYNPQDELSFDNDIFVETVPKGQNKNWSGQTYSRPFYASYDLTYDCNPKTEYKNIAEGIAGICFFSLGNHMLHSFFQESKRNKEVSIKTTYIPNKEVRLILSRKF